MNDNELKQLLKEELKMPSNELNARVLAAVPVKKRKPAYQPMDEPLILGLAVAGLLMAASGFLAGPLAPKGSLLLVVAVIFVIPLFFICSNRITRQKL